MEESKFEDTLIKMIKPKVDEIRQRLSNDESMNLEDVNTLLLHSQFNHINHLDGRMSSIESEVKGLKTEFLLMEGRVDTRFEQVNTRFEQMNARFETRSEQARSENAIRFEQINTRFEQMNTCIEWVQSAMVKNMIIVMSGILTLFKIIDLFIK